MGAGLIFRIGHLRLLNRFRSKLLWLLAVTSGVGNRVDTPHSVRIEGLLVSTNGGIILGMIRISVCVRSC